MNAKTETAAMLSATVDQLAEIKAHISTLQTREAELKEILATAGPDIVEGTQHRAAISWQAKTAINWRAIAEHLKPSRQLITAHTSTGAPFAVIRLSAKKTS